MALNIAELDVTTFTNNTHTNPVHTTAGNIDFLSFSFGQIRPLASLMYDNGMKILTKAKKYSEVGELHIVLVAKGKKLIAASCFELIYPTIAELVEKLYHHDIIA